MGMTSTEIFLAYIDFCWIGHIQARSLWQMDIRNGLRLMNILCGVLSLSLSLSRFAFLLLFFFVSLVVVYWIGDLWSSICSDDLENEKLEKQIVLRAYIYEINWM